MKPSEIEQLQHTVDRWHCEELAKAQAEIVDWPPHFLVCHADALGRESLEQILHAAVPGGQSLVHSCHDDRSCLTCPLPDIWVAVLHLWAGAVDGIDLGARILRRYPRAEIIVCRTVEHPTNAERAERAGIRFLLSEADVATSLRGIVQAQVLYRKQLLTRLVRARVANRLTAECGPELTRLLAYAPADAAEHRTIAELTTESVQRAWHDARGNASQAARYLGISPPALRRLIKRYSIPVSMFPHGSGRVRAVPQT